ncbi:hypothetical protein [Mongoliitalea lutea]|uniref:Uncharacterized protein n=1 Tax=Mongoliitalea lutea TaxID=849756 RepID=A0A8J3CWE1_9BACT|nr:hypothetical protein [Mongoliitalea lutea]GHB35779.1 hypothetical protein GCM10008106_16590 [Mongoliitalea lutea]
MKQLNKIMHLLTALLLAVSLVFFLSFNSVKGILGIDELSSGLVVNFLLFISILFLTAWGTSHLNQKSIESELSKKESEKNELKAKLYDLEQGVKLKNIERKLEEKEGERESKAIRPRQNFK